MLIPFALLLCEEPSALAFRCIVVSGLQQDRSGALTDDPFFTDDSTLGATRSIAGKACKYVNNWAELMYYCRSSKAGLKPGESLVIYQSAHGSPGGNAIVNRSASSEGDSGNEIYSDLQILAQKHRVYFAASSCYSGDIIGKLLMDNRSNTGNPSIDNLCVATASSFGQVDTDVLGEDSVNAGLIEAKRNTNAEAAFQAGLADVNVGGLISSAAWDSSGLTDVFADRYVRSAMDILSTIDKYLSPSSKACSESEVALRDGMHLSREEFRDLLGKAERQAGQVKVSDISTALVNYRRSADIYRTCGMPKTSQCLMDFVGASQSSLNAARRHDSNTKIDTASLAKAWVKFDNSERGRACSMVIWHPETPSSGKGMSHVSCKLPHLDFPIEANISAAGTRKSAFPSDPTQLNGWANVIRLYRIIKDDSGAELMLAQMLNTIPVTYSEDQLMLNAESPLQILNGFVRGSLKSSSFPSSLDMRRRGACRGFKFKDVPPK